MKTRYAQEITFQINTARIYPNEITPFAKLPNWLMRRKELTPGSKIVYCKLGQSAGKEFFACIKLETLANETGFSVAQVKRHIAELVHFGLIEVKQVGLNHANRYYFLQHPWMDEKDHSTKARSMDRVINDQPTVESSQMSHPVSSYMSFPDSSYMSRPLKRSLNKKILLKEHTQESVCVSKNEVSIYSKKEWLTYAQAQKNVYSPQALAEKLSQSKENDHLMEAFLENKLEVEQQQKSTFEQNQQQSLELEERKQSIITEMLALKTLEPWHVKFLNAHGYCVPQQQVC